MPRKPGSYLAYWFDNAGALAGFPERTTPKRTARRDWRERLRPEDRAEITDLTGWRKRLEGNGRALLVFRDRLGFRWEREVGLNDVVSQSDAAQLLGVPAMRVHRLVRSKQLKSRKWGGHSVVRVKDLYRFAVEHGMEVPRGRQLVTVIAADEEDES